MLRERNAAVEVDLEGLGLDVGGRDVRVDARIHPHGADGDACLPGELRDGLVQHLDVELEAERGDVPRLLGAEQIARTADLQVAHGDLEPGPELRVVGERREPGRASAVSSFASG